MLERGQYFDSFSFVSKIITSDEGLHTLLVKPTIILAESFFLNLLGDASFYRSNIFYISTFLLGLIAGSLLYLMRYLLLKKRNQGLEALVAKRTNKIAKKQEEIECQKDELYKLNDVKDKVISLLSHDVRSPLNAISQLLNLYFTHDLSKEDFETIARKLDVDVRQLLVLLDNMLLWVRGQRNEIVAKPERLQLKDIIKENAELVNTIASKKFISMDVDIPSGLVVHADLEMVKLVVRNLLTNAIKFTPEKGNVSISAMNGTEYVTIAVQDTGIGISDEDIPKLFLNKNNHSRLGTSNELGMGLGLVLVQDFVTSNGGKVWVESQEGLGSTFSFTLPKHAIEAAPKKSSNAEVATQN